MAAMHEELNRIVALLDNISKDTVAKKQFIQDHSPHSLRCNSNLKLLSFFAILFK